MARVVLVGRVARAAGGQVVVVDRDLALVAREAHRQLAARVDLAVEHVGHGVAGLDAREPGLEDRRRVGQHVLQHQRAPVEEHDRERLAGVGVPDRLDQLLLLARQVEHRARLRLAAHLARLAEGEHDLVGRLRGRHGGREARLRAALVRRVVEVVVASACSPAYTSTGPCFCMPSNSDTASLSSPRPHQGPSMSCLSSPSGPISAVDLVGSSGSVGPSFFSSTCERCAPVRAAARFCGSSCLLSALRDVRVRMLEQPRAELHAQDAAHRVVDAAHRHLTASHELRPEVAEVRRDHLGVGAGVQRLARRVGAVLGHAVAARAAGGVHARALPQLRHGGVVALDESVEAPALLEDLGLRVLVGAGRHVVERVEARTSRCRRRRRPPP